MEADLVPRSSRNPQVSANGHCSFRVGSGGGVVVTAWDQPWAKLRGGQMLAGLRLAYINRRQVMRETV